MDIILPQICLTLFSLSSLFNGFFIEAGAFDGEKLSNSLLFGKLTKNYTFLHYIFYLFILIKELERNWTGLLVEANSNLVKTIEG